LGWGFLRLLDEAMQDDQHAVVEAEYESCDALAGKSRANLSETLFQTAHQGHTDGPTELDSHEVEADSSAIKRVESAEPLSHRFLARL
jgi:hypothetical protein